MNRHSRPLPAAPRTRRLGLSALCIAALAVALVPTAALATEPCPNEQARGESDVNAATGQAYSTQLPDCRAYELVSSPDTAGIPAVSFNSSTTEAPPAGTQWDWLTRGGALYWISRAVPAGTGAVSNGNSLDTFVSHRAAGGWNTHDLTPFAKIGDNRLIAGARDGSAALILTQTSLVPEDQDNPLNEQGGQYGALDIYRVSEVEAPLLVSRGTLPRTPPANPSSEGLQPIDGFAFNEQLTAAAFVSSAPLVTDATASSTDCYSWVDVGVRLAELTNSDHGAAGNCALLGTTPDGRAVIKDTSGDLYSGLIFVSNGWTQSPNIGRIQAVQISAPISSATTFDTLSPDGTLAYVTTTYPLGEAADGELKRGSEPDVYGVTVPTFPQNTVITPGTSGENTVVCLSCQILGGGAATFIGQSADGSHVFFKVAEASGESGAHHKGLWSWDRSSKTATRLTAATDVAQLIFSQNGQYAAGLTRQLAGNPNGTADVYELSAGQTPRLITSGTAADTYRLQGSGGNNDRPPTAGGISNDGQRVVYDDRPPGSAVLETAQQWSEGETRQLSPLGATSSYYVLGTAGPELEDVLFAAHEPLVPADRNGGTQDVYDARVNGGFSPCTAGNPNPPPSASSCSPAASTPNPQPPEPSSYTAGLTPPTFSLPALPADSSHAAAKSKPLNCRAKARKIRNAKKRAQALKRCAKRKGKGKKAGKSARRGSRATSTNGGAK